MKSQTSLLFTLVVAVAILLGWMYIKYLGSRTMYTAIASRYDIENAIYRKNTAVKYINTAARVAYREALSEASKKSQDSYITMIEDNQLRIPDKTYILDRIGSLTLENTNEMINDMGDEFNVDVTPFKCFEISDEKGKLKIRLYGSRVSTRGNPVISENVNVEFEDPDDILALYSDVSSISREFFPKFKTACDISLTKGKPGCTNEAFYNVVSGIEQELQKIADKYTRNAISCEARIEKTKVYSPTGDKKCREEASCSLSPEKEEFKVSGESCKKMKSSVEKKEKPYRNHASKDTYNCIGYHSMKIEYEVSVVCKTNKNYEIDPYAGSYEDLSFGASFSTKGTNQMGCKEINKGPTTNELSWVDPNGACMCKADCKICGHYYPSSAPCPCGSVYSGGMVVAGEGFYETSNLYNICKYFYKLPDCTGDLKSKVKQYCKVDKCSSSIPGGVPGGHSEGRG